MPGMNVINGQHAVGQRQRALGFTIDGVNAKEPVLGNPNNFDTVMTTSLDMIQEFKMYTTGLPAEFGHTSGGQLIGVMKSGTNQFHGSAEDRYLNGKLVHRQYFEQLRRCQATAFRTGSFLQSVYVSRNERDGRRASRACRRLYNGKDKTFFFGGFQRHHEKVTETFIGKVPTPEMYAGDFNFGGRGFPIYDPATTRQLVDGMWTRDPFPGNMIPQDRIDPVIRNYPGAAIRGRRRTIPERGLRVARPTIWSFRLKAGTTSPDGTARSITSSARPTKCSAAIRRTGCAR